MVSSSGCAARPGASSSLGAAGKDASVFRSEAPATDQRFPRSWRLTTRRQYQSVYNQGRRVSSASFLLFGLPNDVGHCRIGLTVTRKVGGAVVRNRIKRIFRELFRKNRERLSGPYDLVINPFAVSLTRPAERLQQELLDGFDRLTRAPRKRR